MTDRPYAAFAALDPFFRIVMEGLRGHVDGEHYFDAVGEDAVFEFRYDFPGWPSLIRGRAALMELYSGYAMALESADGLVVHRRSRSFGVVILEYAVHGVSPSRPPLRQSLRLDRRDQKPQDHSLAGLRRTPWRP